MAATFQPALTRPLDRVRQLIGDTSVEKAKDVELQDETISYYLTSENGNELRVAWLCAQDLVARYAREVEFTVDHQTTRYNQAHDQYVALVAQLADRIAAAPPLIDTGFSGIYVGGIGDCRGPLDDDCCRRP